MQKTSNFLKITLIYFISLVLFVGIRIVFNLGFLSGVGEPFQDILSTFIIQVGIMLLVPLAFYFLIFRKKPKETFKNIGFIKITWKAVLICFLIGVIAFILNIVISSIFNGIINAFGYESGVSSSSSGDYSFWSFLINVFCVAVLPAFCEEFLHRGVFMRGMFNSISVKHSLIISSICFGLMHLNIVQVFYAAILGLLIGFVSIVGKSIWPAIIIHFTNNFINVYLSFAEANGWWFGNFYDVINTFINGNFILALLVIILVICFLIFALIHLVLKLLSIASFNRFKGIMSIIKNSFKEYKEENPESTVSDYEVVAELEDEILDAMPEIRDRGTANMFFQDNYPKESLVLKDNIFLIATMFLGVFITITTFIWGIL